METYNEKELIKQEFEIRKNLFLAFIPAIIIVIIIVRYQTNSLDYNKEKYENVRNLAFSGIITKKNKEGDYPRAQRYVVLDNFFKRTVSNAIYDKIAIGDSVFKKAGSDSIYFALNNGEIIIEDYNKSLREAYFDLLKKKELG